MRLIDKDALMKKLGISYSCSFCNEMRDAIGCSKERSFVEACAAICDAPEIESEHKTGYWTKVRVPALNGGTFEAFRCSECNEVFNWDMDYCGSCGTKMGRKEYE